MVARIVGGAGPAYRIVVYSGADHTILHELTSPAEVRENFGASVAGAGDVNNDGVPDLLVGATRADVSETITDTGRVYLLSGSDGSVLWEQLGATPQGLLGSGLGQVGDVNGGAIPDQVAAAPGAGEKGLGEAYIYSGVDGAVLYTLSVGDVNADGAMDYMLTAVGQDFGGVAVGHVYIVTFQAKPTLTMQPALVGCQPIQAE